jgi:hypothetical protein
MDKKHSTYLLSDTYGLSMHSLLQIGVYVTESARAMEHVIPKSEFASYYGDDSDSEDPNGDWDFSRNSSVVYISLKYPMSMKELAACWTNHLEPGGPFRGWPMEAPGMRPAKKDFRKEQEYIQRSKVPWGEFFHEYIKQYDISDYNLGAAGPKRKAQAPAAANAAPVAKRAKAVEAKPAEAKPAEAKPAKPAEASVAKPAKPAEAAAASNLLALLSVPTDVLALAKALSATKKDVNSQLYKLQSAGKVSVVSGWGCGEGKGKPMWKVS